MSGPWPFKEKRHRCYETAGSGGLLMANGPVTCRRQASETHPLHMASRVQAVNLSQCTERMVVITPGLMMKTVACS